jgi:hypothetical protein
LTGSVLEGDFAFHMTAFALLLLVLVLLLSLTLLGRGFTARAETTS